jgi:hypothetical protein
LSKLKTDVVIYHRAKISKGVWGNFPIKNVYLIDKSSLPPSLSLLAACGPISDLNVKSYKVVFYNYQHMQSQEGILMACFETTKFLLF